MEHSHDIKDTAKPVYIPDYAKVRAVMDEKAPKPPTLWERALFIVGGAGAGGLIGALPLVYEMFRHRKFSGEQRVAFNNRMNELSHSLTDVAAAAGAVGGAFLPELAHKNDRARYLETKDAINQLELSSLKKSWAEVEKDRAETKDKNEPVR